MDADLVRQMARLEDEHWWFVGRRSILAAVLQAESVQNARLLEIGCGTGGNLDMLSGYGKVDACEPDESARVMAQQRGVAAVQAGGLPELPFAPGTYDVVVVADVLEHVADDRAGLRASIKCLAPGGLLMLTVPAYSWLWSAHDVANHHHRRYARTDLSDLLDALPVRTTRLSYFNTLLFPPAAAVRLTGRWLGRDGHDLNDPSPFGNGLLRRILAWERHVIAGGRRFPFGLSLIATGRVA